jgi:hypothetical protein
MPVRETSKLALEKLKEAPTTQKIFEAILEIGPTHNNRILEFLIQKESFKPRPQRRKWEINQVCGRVHDLIHMYSLVRDLGPHRGRWHGSPKTYHLWIVIGDDRKPAGWRPVPKEALPKSTIPPAEIKSGLNEVKSKAGQQILNAVEGSQALLFSKT